MTEREKQQAGRIKELLRRVSHLEDRILELEALLSDQTPGFIESGFTKTEAAVLAILLKRGVVTKEAMMIFLYSGRIDDAPDPKICDVFVHHVRRKLKSHGITISKVWGVGWRLDEVNREKLRALAGAWNTDASEHSPPKKAEGMA